MRTSWFLLPFTLLLCGPTSGSHAQKPAPAASARPAVTQSDPRIVLEGLSGESSVRALAGFETRDPRLLGAYLVRFEGHAAVAGTRKSDVADVRLSSGERLVGSLKGRTAESLEIEVSGGVRVGAALDDIQSVKFEARVPATWNAPFERAHEGDRLYRRKGATIERIDGGVEEFTESSVKFHDPRIGSLEIAWGDVVALFVEGADTKPPAPTDSAHVAVVVDLVDKSRVKGTLSKIDARGLELERRAGESLRVPPAALALVLVDDGRLVFLSDLAPSKSEPCAPFGDDLGMRFPPLVDASVMGTPLMASGRQYARGIGMHAPSRMTFALDGTYEGLRGFVAVDDSVLRLSTHGSVRFRVLVDGAKRFESKVLNGGDAPVAIVLEPAGLGGAKELVLDVDATEDSFVADRADWLQVVLVRSAAAK